MSKTALDALMADASDAENPELTIDLENRCIRRPNGASVPFELEAFRRERLLEGVDDISISLKKNAAISKFEEKQSCEQPGLNTVAAQ